MHAIARDTEAFPKPCVYLQLDEGSVGMGPEDDDEEDEEEESAELRLVPAGDSEGERPQLPAYNTQQQPLRCRAATLFGKQQH